LKIVFTSGSSVDYYVIVRLIVVIKFDKLNFTNIKFTAGIIGSVHYEKSSVSYT